jgi:molybdopterin synthase sulfur carrier subunit
MKRYCSRKWGVKVVCGSARATLEIKFFGPLKDALGIAIASYPGPLPVTVGALQDWLEQSNGRWRETVVDAPVFCAVNHTVVTQDHLIQSGDEVAFFPPMTGG